MIFKKHNLYSHKQKKKKEEIPNQNKTPNFCRAVGDQGNFSLPEFNRIILFRYC